MEELSLADCFTILRRWKKVFLTRGIVLFVILMAFSLSWSNYKATATVQVEQPEISSAATSSGTGMRDQMQAMADRRISVIQQKVLSTASLIEVITKFNLYPDAREDTPIADLAEKKMFKKIKINLLSSSLANPAAASKGSAENLSAIAFTISFSYDNPLIAQQVTDELVTRFLNQDLKERRTETQQTSAFLEAQIKTLEESLSEQEKRIAEYQSKNGVSRPESLAFNQQIVATLTFNLQSLDSQIATNEGNTGSLRGQLASVDPYSRVVADGQVLTTPTIQLKALKTELASLKAQYGPEHPDVIRVSRQIAALQSETGGSAKERTQLKAQISDVRTNLKVAEKTLGAEHPDVIALRSEVKSLEDQLATAKKNTPILDEGIVADADNPTYLQFASQLRAAKEQHNSLTNQRKELQAQIEKYQKALIDNPEAQKTLASLSRDYENAQLRYRELKEKKMAADMNVQMQKDRTGERLTLINPPALPTSTNPSRTLLFIGSVFLSLMGGLASVVVSQMLSESVIGSHHLESVVGVAPLASVPHIYTQEEQENSMRRRLQRGAYASWRTFVERVLPYSHKHLAPYCERLAPYSEKLAPYSEKLAPYAKRLEPFGVRLLAFGKKVIVACIRLTQSKT